MYAIEKSQMAYDKVTVMCSRPKVSRPRPRMKKKGSIHIKCTLEDSLDTGFWFGVRLGLG